MTVWVTVSCHLEAALALQLPTAVRAINNGDNAIALQSSTLSASEHARQAHHSHFQLLTHAGEDSPNRRLLWQTTSLGQLTRRKHFVDVLVMAPSVGAWLDRRTRLRQQFPHNMKLAPEGYSAILKFALSVSAINDTEAEVTHHSDLIFFDCLDTDDALNLQHNWQTDAGPSSTTCKVMKSIEWAVKSYSFRYFFRLGDDSYFRIDMFLNMLAQNQLPFGKAVIGQILEDEILGMVQQYPQGMGYGLTPEVCDYIEAAVPWLLETAPEDGVVARWLFAVGTKFVNHPGWRSVNDGSACDQDMVLAHKLPAELWSNITRDGLVDC